jgi:hypothetical protein
VESERQSPCAAVTRPLRFRRGLRAVSNHPQNAAGARRSVADRAETKAPPIFPSAVSGQGLSGFLSQRCRDAFELRFPSRIAGRGGRRLRTRHQTGATQGATLRWGQGLAAQHKKQSRDTTEHRPPDRVWQEGGQGLPSLARGIRERFTSRVCRARAREDHGTPEMTRRAGYLAQSLSRLEPWRAEGISRRTWYRRRAAEADGTSPDGTGLCGTSAAAHAGNVKA